jgi:hypothetical protein
LQIILVGKLLVVNYIIMSSTWYIVVRWNSNMKMRD